MTISDFESIRIGGRWPIVVDVRALCGHENYGHETSIYTGIEPGSYTTVHYSFSERRVIVRTFLYADLEAGYGLSKDAVLLFDSRDRFNEVGS